MQLSSFSASVEGSQNLELRLLRPQCSRVHQQHRLLHRQPTPHAHHRKQGSSTASTAEQQYLPSSSTAPNAAANSDGLVEPTNPPSSEPHALTRRHGFLWSGTERCAKHAVVSGRAIWQAIGRSSSCFFHDATAMLVINPRVKELSFVVDAAFP